MPDLGVSEQDALDIAAYLYDVGPRPSADEPGWPPAAGTGGTGG